jgi:hypothetical protein
LPIEKFTIGKFEALKGATLEFTRNAWKHVKFVIIDELSMINYEQLRQIDLRLREIKQNDELFGGVHVILMGDLLQLKPVQGTWIFDQPKCYSHQVHIWRQFEFYQLEINQRQLKDPIFSSFLGRIRKGEQTADDVQLLNSRLFESLNDTTPFDGAIRLMSRKESTEIYNNERLIDLKTKNSVKIYKIEAFDTFSGNGK